MRYTKVILAVLTLASGFALAGCGGGIGVTTPLGGAGVQVGVGAPPPRPY
jgi:hypothetical protein